MQFCNLTTNHVNCGQLCLLGKKKANNPEIPNSAAPLKHLSTSYYEGNFLLETEWNWTQSKKSAFATREQCFRKKPLVLSNIHLPFGCNGDIPFHPISLFPPLPFYIKSVRIQLYSEQGPKIRNHRQ